MAYDSTEDTLEHINRVRIIIESAIIRLMDKAQSHDASKLESPEKEIFDKMIPLLANVTYGSDEYKKMLVMMQPALDHHYANNEHHTEHFANGIEGMTLIDILEMLCDWRAASLRHHGGDIWESLKINAKRFDIPDPLVKILMNTTKSMGW